MRRFKLLFSVAILLFASLHYAQQKDTLKLNYSEKILPFGLTKKNPSNLPKIGLALSGGGSRSISQIGVLRALEEKMIPVDIIVGTSMGSIIGGLYAAGYNLHDLDSIVSGTDWNEFYSVQQSSRSELFVDQKITEDRAIVSFRLDGLNIVLPRAISSGQRAASFLNLLSLNAPIQSQNDFDDFPIKFRAISTDLISGKEVIIEDGALGLAMRASSSVTFLLPPVQKDSLLLVDGGLVANIPSKETRDLGADIVIAVNSSSPLYKQNELVYPWIIADQLVSIPMQILNDQQLDEADFIVEPYLNNKKNTDFSDLDRIINEGYAETLRLIPQIENRFKEDFFRNIGTGLKFYKNFSIENSGPIELRLLNNLINKDSVSNSDLYYQLYLLSRNTEYKNIFFEITEDGTRTSLKVVAEMNPVIKNIVVISDSLVDNSLPLEIFNELIDKPYSAAKVFDAAMSLSRMYKKYGFSFTQIDSIIYDESVQTIYVKLNEKTISSIKVSGNFKTNEKIITREIPLKIGEIFRYEEAEKGLANLRSTNLFDQIELAVKNKDDFSNDIEIKVIEKISSIMRLGLRVDNENLTQFSLDIRDENFSGTGTEIGAILSGGVRNRSYIFEHKANRIFDTYLSYKIRAFYEFNDVNVYRDDSIKAANKFSRSKTSEYRQIFYGGSFGLGAQTMRFGSIFAEARFQNDQIKNKLDYTGPIYNVFITSLRFSLLVDSQNDYPYATDGFLIKSFYETAQSSLGGEIGYTKFFFDYKNIISLRRDLAFTFRGVVGFADNTLPLSEQFSFGGQNSFFGFRDNEYRGRQIFLSSVEYRYKLPVKLFFDTYLKARYDLGSIWDVREQIRFKDLRHGIGATVSFNTPIGPADFSVGKSFYLRNTIPNSTIVWGKTFFYFTIGYYY